MTARCRSTTFVNEFWTSRQRAAHSLHEVSYRACFKPQLPRFFIERLTRAGRHRLRPVHGPRDDAARSGAAGASARRLRHQSAEQDAASSRACSPRRSTPCNGDSSTIDWTAARRVPRRPARLLPSGHAARDLRAEGVPASEGATSGPLDAVDGWIRMVAVNRLTGHSPGFFSVYTLPPNQAVSVAAQREDQRRPESGAAAPRRAEAHPGEVALAAVGLRRADSRRALGQRRGRYRLLTESGRAHTPPSRPSSVDLVVTSPPFLDVVNYAGDNWLRCWFCGIDPAEVESDDPEEDRGLALGDGAGVRGTGPRAEAGRSRRVRGGRGARRPRSTGGARHTVRHCTRARRRSSC